MGVVGMVILGVIILYLVLSYNGLVTLRARTNNAWSQIDVQLKRRSDLIPNLVETVKGYAAHEKETLEGVVQARAALTQASGTVKTAEADNMITGALKSLFAVTENYPELKADKNFQMLQEELDATESKLAYARQFYNDVTMSYNTKLQVFPTNFVAGFFQFKEQEYFSAQGQDREAPKVKFS